MYPVQVNNDHTEDGVLLYGLQQTSFYKETKENKVMKQYINKSALIAEIEEKKDICKKVVLDLRTEENKDYYQGKTEAYSEISLFINTLETKEVDLEKECKIYLKNNFASKEAPDEFLTTLMQIDDMVLFAKHFYELGLAQKGE